MRNQFYWDSRDVSKWSVIAQLAISHQVSAVLQVAMFRPDRPGGQGSTRHDPAHCHPAVKAFFDTERASGVRDFRRVTRLPECCGFRFKVEVVEDGFWGERFLPYRATYFQRVTERLPTLAHPRLVLLDPDTGITAGRYPRPEHVGVKELGIIYDRLVCGDVLLVYQHKPMFTKKDAQWWLRAQGLLQNATAGSTSLQSFVDDDVAFIAAVRRREYARSH